MRPFLFNMFFQMTFLGISSVANLTFVILFNIIESYFKKKILSWLTFTYKSIDL